MEQNIIREDTDLATIIYTSGTTGDPKGVMHTSFTILVFEQQMHSSALSLKEESFFSYLPLCHIGKVVG